MKYVLKDSNELIICEYRIRKINEVRLSGEVFIPHSWYNDEPCDYEYFADVDVKWDGCSHFNFNGEDYPIDKDGYYHICGGHSYLMFIKTMAFITEVARITIEGYDEDTADFNLIRNLNLLDGYTIEKID
ncbi:hypothetical protein [Paraclostridium sordellii]|uniref:hypothetical protein n=1 Tax=Paraclostridium sordellii TaxID=1505 RepID=UPI0012D71655|nr:hypothetical protein [Paeniclostridium sordellii]